MTHKIAMICANAVVNDSRVIKYANTVAAFGYQVAAVGLSPAGSRRQIEAGAVRVVQAANLSEPALSHLVVRIAKRLRRELLKHRADRAAPPLQRGGGRRINFYLRHAWAAPARIVLRDVRRHERAVLVELRRLAPDVVHVHDVYLLGAAVCYARERARAGDRVSVVYDAHEYVLGVANVAPRRIAALRRLEEKHIRAVHRVVAVSEQLADRLQRDYALAERPLVVLNAPVEDPNAGSVQPLRDLVGLADKAPLLVYAGGLVYERGVQTVVDALPQLPDVHLVVVVSRRGSMTDWLLARAATLGVADRFHVAPFVSSEHVPAYIASASLGLSPLLRAPNHDVAVTNKFCEYIAAGIPIVTSDTQAQAALVRKLGLGAVYIAGDADDCARAVAAVLADRDRLATRIRSDRQLRRRFSWTAQIDVIRGLYDGLAGGLIDCESGRHHRGHGDST